MLAVLLLLVMTAFSVVGATSTAADFIIVEPNGETVWLAGREESVIWSGGQVSNETIRVDLMVGPGPGVIVMNIAQSVPVVQGNTTWLVSDNLSSRNDYFVRLLNADQSEVRSARFNVFSPKQEQQVTSSAYSLQSWCNLPVMLCTGSILMMIAI